MSAASRPSPVATTGGITTPLPTVTNNITPPTSSAFDVITELPKHFSKLIGPYVRSIHQEPVPKNHHVTFADDIQRVFYDIRNEQITRPTAQNRGQALRKVLDDYGKVLVKDKNNTVYLDGLYLIVSALQSNPTLFNDDVSMNQFLSEVNSVRLEEIGSVTKNRLRHSLPKFISTYTTFSAQYHHVNELVHQTFEVPPFVFEDTLLPGMCLFPLKQLIPNHVITSPFNYHHGLEQLNKIDHLLLTIRRDFLKRM